MSTNYGAQDPSIAGVASKGPTKLQNAAKSMLSNIEDAFGSVAPLFIGGGIAPVIAGIKIGTRADNINQSELNRVRGGKYNPKTGEYDKPVWTQGPFVPDGYQKPLNRREALEERGVVERKRGDGTSEFINPATGQVDPRFDQKTGKLLQPKKSLFDMTPEETKKMIKGS